MSEIDKAAQVSGNGPVYSTILYFRHCSLQHSSLCVYVVCTAVMGEGLQLSAHAQVIRVLTPSVFHDW